MVIKNVFTNVYGLARSLMALGTLATLLLTDPHSYFNDMFFKIGPPSGTIFPNFFYLFGQENLYVAVGVASLILLWVISGYLPQITGILHAWIIYSFFTGSIIIEGGDQISQIIAILLIPITLFDKRINHWSNKDFFLYERPKAIAYFCYSTIVIIQVQMSILYLFAGADKLHVNEWVEGSAFYYWFNNRPFGANNVVHFIFDPLITNHYLSPLVNWGVIVLELFLFAAIFMREQQKITLFYFAVTFHFMIVVVHGLSSFFLAMAGGLILYLLPVDSWIGKGQFFGLRHFISRQQA
jgi:antimicrobial peptide system SdpB family protein